MPMPKPDIAALLADLRAATGPDRDLDRRIGEAVDAPMGWSGDVVGLGYARFTGSADAAFTLETEGSYWVLHSDGFAAVARNAQPTSHWHHDNRIIAFCIAALLHRFPDAEAKGARA